MNELARRQQYLKDVGKKGESGGRPQQNSNTKTEKRGETREPRQCYVCGGTDHLARSCRKKTESTGQTKQNQGAGARMVTTREDPLDSLQPDSCATPGDIKTVCKSSKPREVLVDVQGVPATGVIDSGADITIMGAELGSFSGATEEVCIQKA